MLTIHARAYESEADIRAIVELQNAVAALEPQHDPFTFDSLRDEYNEPSFDINRNLRLWEAGDTLVMFADMWLKPGEGTLDGMLLYHVRPDAEDEQLDREALAWAEARLREAAAEHPELRPVLRISCPDTDARLLALWPALGFTVARYSFVMQRDLAEPFDEPVLPEGFELRPLAGKHEIPAWVDCYNLSFIDHYNFHPHTVEEMEHWSSTAEYRRDIDLVALDRDGTLAAFCYCTISPSANALKQRSEGWINMLGTRRGYRKRGLGRAMLLAGMRALKAAGMDDARLGVDSQNPSGALRLYEAVGFKVESTWVSHTRELG